MKKKILIILAIWVVLSIAFGTYYKIFGPKPIKIVTRQPIKFEGKTAKEPFKSIGMEIAKIKLKETKQNIKPFIQKMDEFGATNIVIRTETNNSIVFDTLPTVIIGEKKHKDKTSCVAVLYEHKGKQYVVGTCK